MEPVIPKAPGESGMGVAPTEQKVVVPAEGGNVVAYEKASKLLLPEPPLPTRKKIFARSPLKKLPALIVSMIRSFIIWLGRSIRSLFFRIIGIGSSKKFRLLRGKCVIDASEYAWSLNSALLKSAEDSTNDPRLKGKIRFLRENYLAKSAHIPSDYMQFLHHTFAKMFQEHPFHPWEYYRFSFRSHGEVGKPLNAQLGLGAKSPLLLTDTEDVAHVLSLKFSVIDSKEHAEESMLQAFEAHFMQFAETPEQALEFKLESEVILDLTSVLDPFIHTMKEKEKEKAFQRQFEVEKEKISTQVENCIERLIQKYQWMKKLSRSKLRQFFYNNITGISRVNFHGEDGAKIEGLGGIKILPLFSSLSTSDKLEKAHGSLLDFMEVTGLHIGAMNFRRHVLPLLKPGHNVKYAVPSKIPPGTEKSQYFEKRDALIGMELFQRFSERMRGPELQNSPDVRVLGQSTVALLQGLLTKEITDDLWSKMAKNPATQQIVQFSLFQIANHLATAEAYRNNFQKFAQEIELIHCEIATLLELFSPFQREDYQTIYAKALSDVVPEGLTLRTGLGKTAMSTFASISSAVTKISSHPMAVYSKGAYYETAGFIGEQKQFEDVLKDDSVKKIDLYVGQLNPNIEVNDDFTNYQQRDIAGDIKRILQEKPATDRLTVALDCTIDCIHSENNKKILREFRDEIQRGRLNFVFFKSGIKLDQFGMDNYYGAPFYVVNNGASHWAPFHDLARPKAYAVDDISNQWFCLAHRYAADLLDDYRRLIFRNARKILDAVPENLKPAPGDEQQRIRVNTADKEMDASFIDVKISGAGHKLTAYALVGWLSLFLVKRDVNVHSRSSFGFFNPNFNVISSHTSASSTTVRINPGLNAEQNGAIMEFLQELGGKVKTTPI